MAISTWTAPSEGNIFGKLTVDATELVRYIEHARAVSGEKITVTHVVGRAVAKALAAAPGLNGRILFGKFIPHDFVNVTFLVALEGGNDLGKATVEHLDRRTCVDAARELWELAEKLRQGKDEDYEKSKAALRIMPTWLIKRVLRLTGWLASALGVSIPALGVKKFPFGSAVITNVGMFGLDEGFAPFTPFARVPLLVLVGALREAAAVVDGQLRPQTQLTLTATIDHRFIDGFQGGILAKVVRQVLEDPWSLGDVPRPDAG